MKTKEEILEKWEAESADRVMDRFDYYERVVFPSMQEYNDQQTANLKAIKKKQAELINRFLKGNLQIPIRDYSVYQKLKDELFSLQSGEEKPKKVSKKEITDAYGGLGSEMDTNSMNYNNLDRG